MKTRREIFSARGVEPSVDVIPTTVTFRIDKETRRMKPLQPQEKLIVALRKVLAAMSNRTAGGCRYYLDGRNVQIVTPVTTTEGKAGQAQKYRAVVRARVGVCHPEGHKSAVVIQASMSFKDAEDERGLPDVTFFDPTSVEELPRNTPLRLSGLA